MYENNIIEELEIEGLEDLEKNEYNDLIVTAEHTISYSDNLGDYDLAQYEDD